MAALDAFFLKRHGALVLALLAAYGMAYYFTAILLPYTRATTAHPTQGRYRFGNDFYHIWLTSRECLLQRRDPYSPEITSKIQKGIFGRALSSGNPEDPSAEDRAFAYPAFVDFLGAFVAWLPFSVAGIILLFLLPILVGISVWLWSEALGWQVSQPVIMILALLTLSSYPELEALYALQPGIFEAFFLSAACAWLVRGKQIQSGCWLALAMIKPQVSLLLTVYLLLWSLTNWRERKKFAIGFLLMLAMLTLLPVLIWPRWIVGWLGAASKYAVYSRPLLPIYAFGPVVGKAFIVLALIISVWFAWNSRSASANSLRFVLNVCFLLAITTTLLPRRGFYDQIILLPGIMLVIVHWRKFWRRNLVSKLILSLAMGALLWPWIAAPIVIAVHFIAPELILTVLVLPIRTATALPFVVVGLLLLLIRITWGKHTSSSSQLVSGN